MCRVINQIEDVLMCKLKYTTNPKDFQNKYSIAMTHDCYREYIIELESFYRLSCSKTRDHINGHQIFILHDNLVPDYHFILIEKPN